MKLGFPDMRALPQAYRYATAVAVTALLLFLWMLLSPGKGAAIVVSASYSKPGLAQWFFDSGKGFSEKFSSKQPVKAGRNTLRFDLPPGDYKVLRFDPTNNRGTTEVVIHAIALKPAERVSGGTLDLASLHASGDIESSAPVAGGLRVVTRATGGDPRMAAVLAAPLHVAPEPKRIGHMLGSALLFAALAVWLLDLVVARLDGPMMVAGGLVVSMVLIVAMSTLSTGVLNVHPDEPLHLSCFSFFLANDWPVAVGDPSTVASLTSSPFGTAYLNQYDIVYFVAGHLMAAFSFFFSSPLAMARAFQHLMWLILVLMALRSRAWALALGAAVVSPQTWYVFSYFNGDAFSLFLCLAGGALASDPEGGVQRYLRGERLRPGASVLWLALCLGLLIVSKSNYLPVVMGMFLWLAVEHLQLRWRELASVLLGALLVVVSVFVRRLGSMDIGERAGAMAVPGILLGLLAAGSVAWRYWREPALRPRVHRIAMLGGLALLVALPRIVDDLYLNGLPRDKAAAIEATKEIYAAHAFKPSVIAAGEGLENLEMARHGVTLEQMLFAPRHWFELSARSAFGTYGYMRLWAPPGFYALAWWVLGALCAYLVAGLVVDRRGTGAKLVLVAIATSGIVLLSSILFSWVVGFEPQGRYLLPMAGMLCLLMGTAHRWMEKTPGRLLLLAALVLSVYSFACIGIPGIARIL